MAVSLPEGPTAALDAAAVERAERATAGRLLVVDDELSVRLALVRHLRARGYQAETADSGATALGLMRHGRFALMLCDVRMPGVAGVELVERALEIDPDLAVIMMSAFLDTAASERAEALGVTDFLLKPLHFDHLLHSIDAVLHRRAVRTEGRRRRPEPRSAHVDRAAELDEHAARALSVTIAETLINAMEAKDVYLRGHSQRVAELAASIAEEVGLEPDLVEAVRLAGRLHDVGYIGIREEVLNKPGALTAEEYEHVKDHVRIGMDILAPMKHLGVALDYIRDHHEHWDGKGYPRGIDGEDISIGGRIIAAADAFDALTSRRAYREPLTPEHTLAHLADHSRGTRLDPRVYRALSAVVQRRHLLIFVDQVGGKG